MVQNGKQKKKPEKRKNSFFPFMSSYSKVFRLLIRTCEGTLPPLTRLDRDQKATRVMLRSVGVLIKSRITSVAFALITAFLSVLLSPAMFPSAQMHDSTEPWNAGDFRSCVSDFNLLSIFTNKGMTLYCRTNSSVISEVLDARLLTISDAIDFRWSRDKRVF